MKNKTNVHVRPTLEVSQVARKLGVTTRAVRVWIRKGLLPARRRGVKIWTIDRRDFVALAARRGVEVA